MDVLDTGKFFGEMPSTPLNAAEDYGLHSIKKYYKGELVRCIASIKGEEVRAALAQFLGTIYDGERYLTPYHCYGLKPNQNGVIFSWDTANQHYVGLKEKDFGVYDVTCPADPSLQVRFTLCDCHKLEAKPSLVDKLIVKYVPCPDTPLILVRNKHGVVDIRLRAIPMKRRDYLYNGADDANWAEAYRGIKSNKGQARAGDLECLWVASQLLGALKGISPAHFEWLGGKIQGIPALAYMYYEFIRGTYHGEFIHKDLYGHLQQQFNAWLRLEYLADLSPESIQKVPDIRDAAARIFKVLASYEELKKKLWLKKKFVVETNYCLTLDRIPEKFYPEIASNSEQIEEWEKLFAISKIVQDSTPSTPSDPEYDVSTSLSVNFLQANQNLVLDTRFFPEDFKARLIATIDDLDEQCDGLLIHSENFQALQLLRERYFKSADIAYLDPPYNTDATPILYKNSYKHSSWASILSDRILACNKLMQTNGVLAYAIDDTELSLLRMIIKQNLPAKDLFTCIVEHYPGSGTGRTNVSRTHEYCLFSVDKNNDVLRGNIVEDGIRIRSFRRAGTGDNNFRIGNPGRPESFFAILVDENTFEVKGIEPPPHPLVKGEYPTNNTIDGFKRIYPIGKKGEERVWSLSYMSTKKAILKGDIICSPNFVISRQHHDKGRRELLSSVWLGEQYNATTGGTNFLTNIFGKAGLFSYPKSIGTLARVLDSTLHLKEQSVTIDLFAGSGTTGHALIDRNREFDESHQFILIEMGDYFDTVLKPRIQKVVYAKDWKDGEPVSRDTGVSHCFKYLRLESYEDTLNNLAFEQNDGRDKALKQNPELGEDYLLNYMLEVETRESPSLLNIDAFADPTGYSMMIKKPGSLSQAKTNIDLVETFHYLIGLRVVKIYAPETFEAKFARVTDPELPEEQHKKLIVDGQIEQVEAGKWWFRSIEGWVPANPLEPNDGQRKNVLIVWRKLTGNQEEDNAMLDAYFEKKRINPADFEFDVIYVNGSNNLPNLRREDEHWKVRGLEEAFMRGMHVGCDGRVGFWDNNYHNEGKV